MHQEVVITLKLRCWLDAELSEEEIGVYVRNGILAGFPEQMERVEADQILDVIEIEQEADIYHPTQERAFEIVMAEYKSLGQRLQNLEERLDK